MRKNLYNHITAVLALVTLPVVMKAQDIHFSQFYETSIIRNPALTGIFTGDYKVGMVYRTQWNSISKPFQTGVVMGEGKIAVNDAGDYLSFGALAYYDKAGSIEMKTLGVYPAINYNKALEDANESFLSVGFTAGYLQRSFDPSKMTFDEQYQNNIYDPTNPSGENIPNPQINNWDLGAGVSFSSSTDPDGNGLNYFVGVSGYHFTTPNRSFYNNNLIKLDMKWNVSAGVSAQVNEIIGWQGHLNYTQQGPYKEIILGAMVGWNKMETARERLFALYAGVFYRFQDAFIPTMKLNYKDYNFTASYDMNVSTLKAATNLRGGFELSVIKTGVFTTSRFDRGSTLCPKFW